MIGYGVHDVSRETSERLAALAELTIKRPKSINLVSIRDLAEIETRHIADSLQVWQHKRDGNHWLDLGSGGGFPAIPLAVLSKEDAPEMRFTCIESDQRKCAFLRTAGRELELNLNVVCSRIDDALPQNADILTARALAPLDVLLGFASKHLASQGLAMFPKGQTWQTEVEVARKVWRFDLETHPSVTSPDARILLCSELARVDNTT
mgnify:CR=1 FL=1